MPFIGLTGGLGTGKTTAMRFFKNAGAYTINADKLVHKILKKPSIIKKLVALLDRDILTKRKSKILVNKKRMADIIFDNFQKRKAVEKIIHPEVIKIANGIKTKTLAKKPDAIIIFEVPLLFEGGYNKIFDKVIVVYCSKKTAIKRLEKRGIILAHALKRIRAQMPISLKKATTDFLIDNNSDINNLRSQVKSILKKLSADRQD